MTFFSNAKKNKLMPAFPLDKIDKATIEFSDITRNKHGGQTSWIRNPDNARGKNRLTVQFYAEHTPFGVEHDDIDGNPQKKRKNMDLNMTDPRNIAGCEKIDKLMIDTAIKHSKAWFGKVLSPELIKDKYRPCATAPTDKWPGRFRVKMKHSETEKTLTRILVVNEGEADATYTAGTIDQLVSHTEVVTMADMSFVWFIGKPKDIKSFGVSYAATVVMMYAADEEEEDFPQSMAALFSNKPQRASVKAQPAVVSAGAEAANLISAGARASVLSGVRAAGVAAS